MWPPLGKAATISVLGNQFRVEVTLHKWQMLETAFALRPVLFRTLDAPTSGAWLCSWSIHHRHDAGDAAQSDLRDFCNRPQRVISNREPISPHRPPVRGLQQRETRVLPPPP